MGAAQDRALGPVEAESLVTDQPGAGKAREPAEIDMAFLERVMPRDVARQHPRIRRLDIARNECDAHARHRPHAKGLQYVHMSMPAADEHEILIDCFTLPHLGHYALSRASKR